MQKVSILNRDGRRICVYLDLLDAPRGLFCVMHGLGRYAEQAHIIALRDVLLARGYSVVRFDARGSHFGESEGTFEEATVTGYLADLHDVLAWAREQVWYTAPLGLVGHSLGGLCTSLYAEAHPDEVMALVPIATAISGTMNL